MKIKIYKKDNDENVYYTVDDKDENRLNFENIKQISKVFLKKKSEEGDTKYEITVVSSELELYKTTLENVINSILEDEELLKLYIENQSTEDAGEKDN